MEQTTYANCDVFFSTAYLLRVEVIVHAQTKWLADDHASQVWGKQVITQSLIMPVTFSCVRHVQSGLWCRCVVMVGMPFSNPTDPELQERMRFMDSQQQHVLKAACPADGDAHLAPSSEAVLSQSASFGGGSTGPALMSGSTLGKGNHLTNATGSTQTAGREYYEDLCMKAVNQCVGRVIRHRNDYAAIVLADARWGVGNAGVAPGGSQLPVGPLRKLPEWIQGSLTVCNTFGDAYGRLHRFHRQMLAATTPS